MDRRAKTASKPSTSIAFALRFTLFGRVVALDLGRRGTLVAAGLCGAVVLWGFIAGAILGFHDEIVTALVAQQADLSFGYEDQIADLRSQVSRESSRSLLNRHTLQTVLTDLGSRTAQLEERQKRLDGLVADEAGGLSSPACLGRNRQSTLRGSSEHDHADLSTDGVSGRLARLSTRQDQTASAMQGSVEADVQRIERAVDQAGVARRVDALASEGVGGPFEAMPDAARGDGGAAVGGAASPDQIRRLAADLARRDRLQAAVERVPLGKPLDGPVEVSSTFGPRTDPFLGRPALHTGIDLHQSADDAVHATASGTVTIAGSAGGYGDMVEIDHGGGLATRYAHLSAIAVTVGEKVTVGGVVGRVGSTGRSTGPHLHYETRVSGEPVDPARFLRAAVLLAGG